MSSYSILGRLRANRNRGFALGRYFLLFAAVTPVSVVLGNNGSEIATARDFAELSLEELMNETVTSVSKREERRIDAAAAVSVLSNREIAASGSVTIPDALRTVPGVNVASVNAGDYAVSIRGYNHIYANKLLVLIDGRTVYAPTFAGVFWDLQQPMLEDLDRIEVIRGPGATIWGANAVNGVINVVSRSARETQGGMAYAGVGDVHEVLSGARFGGRAGSDTYYRIFGSYRADADRRFENGDRGMDGRETSHGGFRLDHYGASAAHFTWQGDFTTSELSEHDADRYNVNTLARWSRDVGAGSKVEVQSFYDRTFVEDPNRASNRSDTWDLTVQHSLQWGADHSLIWGAGCRLAENRFTPTNSRVEVLEEHLRQDLASAFVQDEWALWDGRLMLTAGCKVEHNDFTGFEVQPSIRATLRPAARQILWAAISRAVRTPSQLEGRNLFAIPITEPIVGPGGGLYVPTIVGNRNIRSEVLWAYELGYRFQIGPRVNVDLATFYHDYQNVVGMREVGPLIPGDPVGIFPLQWDNQFAGSSYGAEVAVTVMAWQSLRLRGSYSYLVPQVSGPGTFYPSVYLEESAPRNQVSVSASYRASRQLNIDGQIRYVGELQETPSYVAADLRIAFQMTDDLEFSLVGQNLFESEHAEQGRVPLSVKTEVPRSIYGKVVMRF